MLPLQGETVIARLLKTLQSQNIDGIFALVPQHDEALAKEIRDQRAIALTAEATAEMRASVILLLSHLQQAMHPGPADAWLLVPGDHPLLSRAALAAVIAAWKNELAKDRLRNEMITFVVPEPSDRVPIIVPTHGGRGGHPTLFPWSWTNEIFSLAPGLGLNHLLRLHPENVLRIEVNDPQLLWDLDTPEDYAQALREA